ncbi:5-guanidino-2-oxopentanoate decarboxylase [Pseudomonas chlororaphis]|uniref:5-guanidino-2-oxopentanoate decarboxylase n=1 Tax=Pseudomonas chlororaphis TaxID=587753 RepID=UPI000F565E55|nr:5-guanidino-2-oxopentanoate decarboxylase [Pseudomonas chlororaphis]AZC50334.1 Acetohydroxy acid synthase [Pseudomonas chlororaphis subsp. piscium]AZC56910.1 Acetohydroxy acid synthase [Pseudomonas chlororaphis subsp. piscium]AZC75544.1 Acetohydroxy acid synthase [Pseudomonas chlororaphis subsp. piscium]AZC81826.1 Acetohydroxy acid synthase [Pseudomonas chlororaphis subsp. piscium]MBP5054932.1 5-guanidino-2-oxopentanoate decarboxylase [Pseudomonas chlororaphis]
MHSTTLTGGQALVRLLANYGVDTVFGIPGVHTLELYRGLPGSGIRHVLTRHEQGAGFMADGYARVSGKPGVCFVITGPGVTNAATAIGQAYADSIPMLVISSVNHTASLGKGWGCLHETQDQRAMTAPITAFSAVALSAEDLPELIARAYAVFDSERPRPVHISVPLDVLAAPVARDWSAEVRRRPGRGVPTAQALDQAAARLQAARRPMIIAGGGALDAAQELQQLSTRLAAPFFSSVAGKGLLAPQAPLNAGSTLCVEPGWQLIGEADVVLAVGTEMADTDYWRERLPLNAELLRVDIDPRKFNDFYPCALALQGDARQTVAALLQRLEPAPRDATSAIEAVARLRAAVRAGHGPLQLIHQAILERVAAELPEQAFVSSDMTQLAYTGNYLFASRAPRSWLHPTGYGTLGYGLPAGIGAKFGAPRRPGLVLVGDGGFLYTAQELATAVEELDSPLVILLWNNDALGQIRDDMLGLDIEPIGVLPRNPDFAALGRAFGCTVAQPQSLDQLQNELRSGFRRNGVTLIELKHACAR